MPLQPDTILTRVVIFQHANGITSQNVFHFTNRQVVSDTDYPQYPLNLIQNFNAVAKPTIQAFQASNHAWVKATATVIVPINGPAGETQYAPLDVGGQADSATLAFVSAVMKKDSHFSGRRNRGRTYVGGVPADNIFEEALTAPAFARLQAIASQLTNVYCAQGASSQYELVLYSHRDGDVAGLPTLTGVKSIQEFIARQQIFTQRHRLLGVGT